MSNFETISLTGVQLLAALNFLKRGGEDWKSANVSIAHEATPRMIDAVWRPIGLYCWMTEYPEEGSIHLPEDGK